MDTPVISRTVTVSEPLGLSKSLLTRFQLSNGQPIPLVHFGVWELTGPACTAAVLAALDVRLQPNPAAPL